MKILINKIVNSGKLIIAVYASVGYVHISCTYMSSWVEVNSRFVELGDWGVRGSEQNI